jgi:hypothetical protein
VPGSKDPTCLRYWLIKPVELLANPNLFIKFEMLSILHLPPNLKDKIYDKTFFHQPN